MGRQRVIIYVLLLAAWLAFGGWQYRSFGQQRELIQATMHRQAHSIMSALLGGMRSHRRLGPFFETQVRGMLDELVKSDDVLAVGLFSHTGDALLVAGQRQLVHWSNAKRADERWDRHGYRLVEPFELAEIAAGPPPGGGRGRGFGARRRDVDSDAAGPFDEGGKFQALLILDPTWADELARRVAWSYGLATIAAGLVAVCLALAWRATVHLAEVRARARVAEAETRHLRELSQAAAGLAHETRNPLGLIRGWTQRLADAGMPEQERRQHAQTVMEECDRVTARINQFLAFARPRHPEARATHLGNLVAELTAILQPDLEGKQMSLVVKVARDAAWIEADHELLRQAAFNLIQNAIQSAPAGDAIQLDARTHADRTVTIEVADRGPGVPNEAADSLFTPYFTTRPQGTGLGLAIVRHIATLHGWTASYRPRPGGGAIFDIRGIHVADEPQNPDRG